MTKEVRPPGNSIITMLMQHEEQIARLYSLFAASDPTRRDFWKSMVEEERGHVRILAALQDQMSQGSARIQVGIYDLSLLGKSMSAVGRELQAIGDCRNWGERSTEALAHALAIEQSIAENRFYEVTTGDSPVAKKMKEGMRRSVAMHVERIQRMLDKATEKKR